MQAVGRAWLAAFAAMLATRSSSAEPDHADRLTAALGDALGADGAASIRVLRADVLTLEAIAALAEQAVRAIDYATLGQSWEHPETRTEYRHDAHRSQAHPASRRRQSASRAALARDVHAAAADMPRARHVCVRAFVREIGLPERAAVEATFFGTLAALRHELLHPLRSLHEGRTSMERTFNGEHVPRAALDAAVDALIGAVLRGEFHEWRYTNPVGVEQLRGLTPAQLARWQASDALTHAGPPPLTTTDGHARRAGRADADAGSAEEAALARAERELDLFWATKIGGPSHGFDYEGQCLLPLLCNARHKVVTVHDRRYPHHAAGRAHLRLLWRYPAEERGAVLWVEGTHVDFRAAAALGGGGGAPSEYARAVLTHALAKACALRLPLAADAVDAAALGELARGMAGCEGVVGTVEEPVVLRPSNGVVEASDYLSSRHDWVQLAEERTAPLWRALFVPSDPNAAEAAAAARLDGAPADGRGDPKPGTSSHPRAHVEL